MQRLHSRDRTTVTDVYDEEEYELQELLEHEKRRGLRRQDDWDAASRETSTVFESQTVDNNSAFQVKGNRRRINQNELFKIKVGDHIGFHRPYIIWHHAIVSGVDEEIRQLRVIHYTKKGDGIKVVEEWINVKDQRGNLYIFDYPNGDRSTIVLQRARNKIGSKGYRFLGNNCEHFASFCKTGKSYSYQVRWLGGKVKETIQNANVLNAGKVATAEAAESLTTDLNIVGAAGVAVFETIHCTYDIYRLNKARKCGEMKERDFKVSTTQRVSEAVFGGGLAIVGGLFGGPVTSVVLGVVGALVGKALGSWVGRLFGEWLW